MASASTLIRSILWHWRFPKHYGAYRGIYRTFAEAEADAPKSGKLGYDHAVMAEQYERDFPAYRNLIGTFDYPVMFWLQKLLEPNQRVFDFGGNVGNRFYSYRNYLNFPGGLHWVVCELPEIVKVGRRIAEQQRCRDIAFTTQFEDASGCDVLMASGSVQYLGASFADQLARLPVKPRHLVISRTPLCDGESFVTLQNGGPVFYPSHVMNREAFTRGIADLGYELRDAWKDISEPCAVPFHPEFATLSFHGLVFRRTDP
jgi:putative methyltransferase (TIGR04325 family)